MSGADAADTEAPGTTTSYQVATAHDITMFVREHADSGDEAALEAALVQAEEFIKTMPDIEWEVIKINGRGAAQTRIIRLKSDGIYNVKKTKVRNVHKYSEVKSIRLKDTSNFVIEYFNDHDFRYRSPAAIQIVQELSSRLQVRKATEKKKAALDPEAALAFQRKLLAGTPTQDNDRHSASSPNITNERRGSSPHASPTASPKLGPAAASSAAGPAGNMMLTTTRTVAGRPISFRARSSTVQGTGTADNRRSKLAQLLGHTQEQRLQSALEKITLDPDSNEGRTIAHYVENIDIIAKNPGTAGSSVRQFIDGMRSYIMDNRREELVKLVVSTEDADAELNREIEKCLEKRVIVPGYGVITKCIQQQLAEQQKGEDISVIDIVKMFASKTQAFFAISEKHQSARKWAAAVNELRGIDAVQTPTEKFTALLDACKAIYHSYQRHNPGSFLAADDFLPIFIYVLVHSQLEDPELMNEFLWALADPSLLSGEFGYYLTVFGSALQFLKQRGKEYKEGGGSEKDQENDEGECDAHGPRKTDNDDAAAAAADDGDDDDNDGDDDNGMADEVTTLHTEDEVRQSLGQIDEPEAVQETGNDDKSPLPKTEEDKPEAQGAQETSSQPDMEGTEDDSGDPVTTPPDGEEEEEASAEEPSPPAQTEDFDNQTQGKGEGEGGLESGDDKTTADTKHEQPSEACSDISIESPPT